jgi:hypothetical protein
MQTKDSNAYTGAFTHLLDIPLQAEPNLQDYERLKAAIIHTMDTKFPGSEYWEGEEEDPTSESRTFFFSIAFFENLVLDFDLNYDPSDGLTLNYEVFDHYVSESIELSTKSDQTDSADPIPTDEA